ncbi:hypothetical protein TRFO_07436 [Tritrichomonas foetus]|uniref:Protein kinase domain-containing protein n=1 Tax=Tritrichomonas foetus TaxID=1144522 RepID=A0A1J4JTS8_9EUKA|nr:hypothetical protein TRFO_07436 [Tritrichomonas foetus]|eukprot:OHT01856.1 hypothetical protein TRFO_07436 [Tritrichomonas foetus]
MEKYLIDIEDEYEEICEIGRGGFGVVKLIQNQQTNSMLAAKITIFDTHMTDKQQVFLSEIEVLARLSNPAILKFHGFNLKYFNMPEPVILTEYCCKGSLSKLLERLSSGEKIIEWTEVKKCLNILGIAIGMKYLHSENIIHRDLKPGNILLDEYYYPLISDFGLSKMYERQEHDYTETSRGRGTPMYLAPEIIKTGKYSTSVDVFSYSFIVYEILTNRRPLSAENEHHITYQIAEGIRPDLSFISNERQKSLLRKMWDPNPEERPSFDEIVEYLIQEIFSPNKEDPENDFLDEPNFFDIDFNSEQKSEIRSYLSKFDNIHLNIESRRLGNTIRQQEIENEEQRRKLWKKFRLIVCGRRAIFAFGIVLCIALVSYLIYIFTK